MHMLNVAIHAKYLGNLQGITGIFFVGMIQMIFRMA